MHSLAATLELTQLAGPDTNWVQVRVINETGHKLPTGYPEGRRMWLEVVLRDAEDAIVYHSGAYNADSATIADDPWLRKYETKPGVSHALSSVLELPPGPTFHFAINDTVWWDNRIPPRGFTNAAFEEIQSAPRGHGVSYADDQYWDDALYPLVTGAASVEAILHYQTISREYVEFLRDANVTDEMGDTLYELWSTTGKAPPEEMVRQSLQVDLALAAPVCVIQRTPSGLLLSWAAVSDADFYRVYSCRDGATWEICGETGELSLELDVPVGRTIVLFRVTAVQEE